MASNMEPFEGTAIGKIKNPVLFLFWRNTLNTPIDFEFSAWVSGYNLFEWKP